MTHSTNNDLARLIALFVEALDDACYNVDEDDVTVERGVGEIANPDWSELGGIDEQLTVDGDKTFTIRGRVQARKGDARCEIATLQITADTFLLITI